MSISVDGDERVIRKLIAMSHLGDNIGLLEPAAQLIAKELRAQAPRGSTGDLAGSIEVTVDGHTVTVGPGREGFYGFFLEYGTSKMSARPWFRPAVDRSARPAVERIGQELGRALARIWT